MRHRATEANLSPKQSPYIYRRCPGNRHRYCIGLTMRTSAPPPSATVPDAAVVGTAHRQQRQNVTRPQTAPDGRRVIAAVAEHAGRPAPGLPRPPCRSGIASTRAKASCESFRLAAVRRTASGMPCPSQIRCRLLPRLARSVGFGPVFVAPHTARTEQLSTMARDQSMSR